jgi:hypothetical protein
MRRLTADPHQFTGKEDVIEDQWIGFLDALEKSWNKLRAVCKHDAGLMSWLDGQWKLKEQDPLLRYVREARNTDWHDNLDVAKRLSEETAFVSPCMPIAFEHRNIRLIPVRDRKGNTIPVPLQHLGLSLGGSSAVEVAELALAWHQAQLAHIETWLRA